MTVPASLPTFVPGEWDGKDSLTEWECRFFYALMALQGKVNRGAIHPEVGAREVAEAYDVSVETVMSFLQPRSLFLFPMIRRMSHVAWATKRSHFFRRLFPREKTQRFWAERLQPFCGHHQNLCFMPLTDLGAFSYDQVSATLAKMRNDYNVHRIVLMEDRNPKFFLNHGVFNDNNEIPLNRHGPDQRQWTVSEVKAFVQEAHNQGIEVILGFWCNYSFLHPKQDLLLQGHIDNPFIQANKEALAPTLLGSDDMNVYCWVNVQGTPMKFASYIGAQFQRLSQEFGFDGLFIGDGGMGLRNFLNLDSSWDFSYLQKVTHDFYREIHGAVASLGKQLYAYDCNGYGYEEAITKGVSYRSLLGTSDENRCLDNLVVQMYPEAWGNYMRVFDRRDPLAVKERVESVLQTAHHLSGRCVLTLEIGDAVEGWSVSSKQMETQLAYFEQLACKYSFDILGVWTNEWIASLI